MKKNKFRNITKKENSVSVAADVKVRACPFLPETSETCNSQAYGLSQLSLLLTKTAFPLNKYPRKLVTGASSWVSV